MATAIREKLSRAKSWQPYTEDYIRRLLETSAVAVEHGLVDLYRRQTPSEQAGKHRFYANRRGFSHFDAEFGTSLAQQIIANRQGLPEGCRLTERQFQAGRRLVLRYVGQLTRIANGKL